MSTHYDIVTDLLDFAKNNNDENEFKRLYTYIDKMHLKCINQTEEKCSLPCTVQKTNRGNFCVYKPGEIYDIDSDILKKITSYSEKNTCCHIFFRMEPTVDNRINVVIYIPSWISDTIFEYYLSETLSTKFNNVQNGSYTSINAVLKERPFTRNIIIDDNTDDIYKTIKFTSEYINVTPITRFVLKKSIMELLLQWASRFKLTLEDEKYEGHTVFGSLLQLKVCKNIDNLKTTNKNIRNTLT